jgi:hypothetical protein
VPTTQDASVLQENANLSTVFASNDQMTAVAVFSRPTCVSVCCFRSPSSVASVGRGFLVCGGENRAGEQDRWKVREQIAS